MHTVVLTISLLSLLHPKEVILRPTNNARLTIRTEELQPRQLISGESMRFTLIEERLTIVASPQPITVEIPGKFTRTYPGPLRIHSVHGLLEITTTVSLETAVAWAVEAESMPNASAEARKALAVVARSWFLATRGRHGAIDACDTTHCQYLGSPKAISAEVIATQGMVMLHEGKPLEAMHHANCGGRTQSLADVGLATQPYPFYSVKCPAPATPWNRPLSSEDTRHISENLHHENTRIVLCRRLGWDAIPSNNYQLTGNVLHGKGRGHGVGLCQEGAAALAEAGSDFATILRHFFPNTLLTSFR